jgi:AcrR family transcriptional regulator
MHAASNGYKQLVLMYNLFDNEHFVLLQFICNQSQSQQPVVRFCSLLNKILHLCEKGIGMNNHKNDRRIERTRRQIKDALVSLMLEKDYDRITVQEIIDRADIGRSTFYAHYVDKEDLLLRGVAEIVYGEELDKTIAAGLEHPHPAQLAGTISMLPMFEHVRANDLVHKAMFEKNRQNPILEKGTEFLFENIRLQLTRLLNGKPSGVPIPVLAQYLTGGLIALIKWWQEEGSGYSAQEMDELFQRMAMPGILNALGPD